MTATFSRTMLAALMASALGACAMEAPAYPVRESSNIGPQTGPAAGIPAVSRPIVASPAAVTVAATDTETAGQPERRDAAATSEVVQTEALPPVSGQTSPAPDTTTMEHDRAPIIEAPSGPGVQPPINHRPGFDREPAAPTPAPTPMRGKRARTPPAPPPEPAARPLVAGRVESVDDLSHTIDVEKGDTVNTISDGLMTPKEALIKANRLKKPFELEVGRSLKIPIHKAYVVQSGDSLYGIARRFSTPVDVLSDLNHLDAKSRLHPGQKVALPDLARDTGAQARPGETRTAKARPGESAAQIARAEETAPASGEAPMERASAASSTMRSDPYAAPGSPRPYASVSPRPPTRPAYPSASTAETATPLPSDSQIQVAGRGRFIWPVRGDVLSGFGPKPGGQRNDGVDITAPEHSAVRAAASGDVVYAGDQIPGFGNLVLIKHEGGWVTAYAHLSTSEVKIREHVSQGAEIGQVGQTGGVDQPQLHFEIRYAPSPHDKARPIDPSLVLSSQSDQ